MPTPFFGLTDFPEFVDVSKQKEPEIESERHFNQLSVNSDIPSG